MKKRILLLAAFVAGALGMRAQTDVTDLYLTNAGFDTKADFITANKTTSSNSTVTDWVASANQVNSCGAVVEYGSSLTLNGKTNIDVDKFGKASGGALGISTGWNQEVVYTQDTELPAGTYKITFDVINRNNGGTSVKTNKFGWVPENGTPIYNTTTKFEYNFWYTISVEVKLTEKTKGKISVGGVMAGEATSNSVAILFVDNVKIFKMDEGEPTLAHPVDYSDLLNQTTWSVKQDDGETTSSDFVINITGGDWTGRYVQRYRGYAGHFGKALYQTVTVPAGVYQVQAACMSASTGVDNAKDGDLDIAYFYANDKEMTYALSNARGYFRKHFVTLKEEGEIEFGINTKVVGANWNAISCATLVKVANDLNGLLAGMIESIDVETNVGDGAFQIPTSAVASLKAAIATAQGINDSNATEEELLAAIDDLTAAVEAYKNAKLNEPEEGQRFTLTNNSEKYDYAGKTITFIPDAATNGGFNYQHKEDVNKNLGQGFAFTPAEGVNEYYLSFVAADGEVKYVTNGESAGSTVSWNKSQIQTTTDESKRIAFRVEATDKANIWNLYNTVTGEKLGANGKNNISLYSVDTFNDYTIAAATPASVEVSIAAGKYATRIFPFVPELEGVTFYSCTSVNKETSELGLDKVESPKANTPYVLYAANGVEETLTGYGTATTLAPVTAGLLVGSFESIKIEAGNYVLQTNPDTEVQAFYIVGESGFESTEYRAYLAKSADIKGRDAFFFGEGEATGINGIEQGMNESMVIYNLQGQRVAMPTRGIYIVNGKKVMVK